jgi:hypothetical protein
VDPVWFTGASTNLVDIFMLCHAEPKPAAAVKTSFAPHTIKCSNGSVNDQFPRGTIAAQNSEKDLYCSSRAGNRLNNNGPTLLGTPEFVSSGSSTKFGCSCRQPLSTRWKGYSDRVNACRKYPKLRKLFRCYCFLLFMAEPVQAKD